jgi:hypothetical protein
VMILMKGGWGWRGRRRGGEWVMIYVDFSELYSW